MIAISTTVTRMKKVFVYSPHADDAEIGVGGYIARTIGEGGQVMVALATVGDVRFAHLDGRIVGVDERVEEFERSMGVLGVQHTRIMSVGNDGTLHMTSMGAAVAALDSLIDEFRPDEVLIPLSSSHQDHRFCWHVGIAATRPNIARHQPRMVAAYEYPLTFWGSESSETSFKGGVYVNVTSYWGKKLDALKCYASQMRGPSGLISIQGVEALANLRGMESGCSRAELLHALRIVID